MTQTLVIVDGGMVSGWRRATPSIGQLHQAVVHLHAAHPDVRVAVVGDPALKHTLSPADQMLLDADIEIGAIVFAPAGTIGGFHGFLGQIVDRATGAGFSPVVITDRSVPQAPMGRLRIDGGRWIFDLDGAVASTAPTASTAPARRRRGGGRRA